MLLPAYFTSLVAIIHYEVLPDPTIGLEQESLYYANGGEIYAESKHAESKQ